MSVSGAAPARYGRIYEVVGLVPRGRVATYGQIARIAGQYTPRMVGYAMAALPAATTIPWHRVVNSRGRISERASGDGAVLQRRLLEAEGIDFGSASQLDLGVVGWDGPGTPFPSLTIAGPDDTLRPRRRARTAPPA